jgi:spore germination protein YaaH
MATNRLPIISSDGGNWGTILNSYLRVSLGQEGGLNVWTNSTRPPNPDKFVTGINTTTGVLERWNETNWVKLTQEQNIVTNLNITGANSFVGNLPKSGSVYRNSTTSTISITNPVTHLFTPMSSWIWDSVINKFIQLKQELVKNSWNSTTSGYIFMSNTGSAQAQALTSDIQKFKPHYLKPQWLNINDNASSLILTLNTSGMVNGYNQTNEDIIIANTQLGPMPMIKGETVAGVVNWPKLIDTATKRTGVVNYLLAQLAQHPKWIGFEIDFEPTATWGGITQIDVENKYLFLKELCLALHNPNVNKLVSVAIAVTFDNEDKEQLASNIALVATGIDYLMIMNYDLDYPNLTGSVAPVTLWTKGCQWALATVPKDKLVMGIPSYGSFGTFNCSTIGRLNKPDVITKPNYALRTRNSNFKIINGNSWIGGNDMYFNNGTTVYTIPDTVTLDTLRQIGENLGIKHFSVWSLSGNDWFSGVYTGSTQVRNEPNFYQI